MYVHMCVRVCVWLCVVGSIQLRVHDCESVRNVCLQMCSWICAISPA
jgi:hypothetical protein